MHAAYAAAKIISASASVFKATSGMPRWLAYFMAATTIASTAAAANRIPVKVFRIDRPAVDHRRAKRFFRRYRRSFAGKRIVHIQSMDFKKEEAVQ